MRTRLAIGVVPVVAGLLAASGMATAAALPVVADGPGDRAISRVMDKPRYQGSQWGMLEVDPFTGRTTRSRQPTKSFAPGSVVKLFSVSAAWNTLGPRHRFVTPLFALGQRSGSTLNGNLVLQAAGDLTMGGRTLPNGRVAFADLDHTYANAVPGTTLTAPSPLAGIERIARQVRSSGITRIEGDVAIDNRLWQPDPQLQQFDPGLDPMIINDNVIDVRVRPTAPGKPAKVFWRPQTAAIRVTGQVATGRRSSDPGAYPNKWRIDRGADGHLIVRGTIPANARPQLLTAPIDDPAAFARTALVEALGRAGVTVTAPAVGDNPTRLLPTRNSYRPADRVAAYRSPPFGQYLRLILKTSHNLGAEVALCQLAVLVRRTDCQRGFAVERSWLRRAGVNVDELGFTEGRGADPNERVTPRATMQLLRWWMRRPDFTTFRRSLPSLGVNGDLGGTLRSSPARGKVFAKTGTLAEADFLNERLFLPARMMAGYLAGPGPRHRPFVVVVNSTFVPTPIANIFDVIDDVARIAALMQQNPG